MKKVAALALVAVVAGYGFHALAQVRPDVRQAVTPIGTSSSNGISFAWFYDATERAVFVCRSGPSGGDPVECKSRAALP
jgi:hypothetical protein